MPQLIFFGVLCAAVGFSVAWIRARDRVRWLEGKGAPRAADATDARNAADRTDRLERAMDAIALEVERIAEHQRFIGKVISERPNVPRAEAPPRVITPH